MKNGKHIMITRPRHQAGPLVEATEAAGGKAFLFPTIEIVPAELSPAELDKLRQINLYDIIIFISPNAVEYGLNQIEAAAPLAKNVLLATIGQGSARAFQNKLGKMPDIVPQQNFNSEGLLATPAMHAVAGKRILIVRGNPGREALKEELEHRGARVDYLSVYRRTKPENNPARLEQYLQNQEIAAIVMTSAESLHNLLEMVPVKVKHNLLQLPLVLINQRLVSGAREAGFNNTLYIASAASDDAIIEVLVQNKLLS